MDVVPILEQFLSLKSKHTARAYKTVIGQFLDHLKQADQARDIFKTFPGDALSFLSGIASQAPATVRHRYNLLNSFFSFLVDMDYIAKNPITACRRSIQLRRRSQVRPTRLIEPGAILSLLKLPATDTEEGRRDLGMLTVFCAAGLRRSELRALNLSDVMMSASGTPYLRLRLTKAGPPQERTLAHWAWEAVSRVIIDRKTAGAAPESPLFVNVRGYAGQVNRLDERTIARMVNRYGKRINLDIAPHCLRASFATQLKRQNFDDRDVALALGHGTEHQVRIYDKRSRTVEDSPAKKISYA